MLRVCGDQISGWYHAHMSHNGWSYVFNWKGCKTLLAINCLVEHAFHFQFFFLQVAKFCG